jgi:peptidoglycan hydrolase-like protein with peptidoglycan-binding domain
MQLTNKIFGLLILAGVLLLSGCGSDESMSAQEKQLKKLSATWVVTNATMGGTNYTADYADFELTLSGSANSSVYAYGVLGRPEISPWPAGGTWAFGSDVKTMLTRDSGADQLSIAYTVTNTQLTMSFSFTGEGYSAARVNSVSGNWTYTFSKK